jgi:2-methylfumaryl-CoA hydratase
LRTSSVGQTIVHATPRTITEGDVALYTALTGSRFATNSADTFAHSLVLPRAPVDNLLAFNVVFGKTVPDISLNAIANLGYAAGRFGHPIYPGDTLTADSTVIGLKENSDGKTGIVYVRSCGVNQRGQIALDYCRWVMVRKRDPASPAPAASVPELPDAVAASDLIIPTGNQGRAVRLRSPAVPSLWDDYRVGERIDHVDGMTIEESEHMMATRLYQNTARVHFNQQAEKSGTLRTPHHLWWLHHQLWRARCRSTAWPMPSASRRSTPAGMSRQHSPAIRYTPGRKSSNRCPCLAAMTWALRAAYRGDQGPSLRRLPLQEPDGSYDPSVLLDFDYTVLMPKRPGVAATFRHRRPAAGGIAAAPHRRALRQ